MERLRFLHIPKTAGSTFTSVLERQYSRGRIFDFTGDNLEDRKKFGALSVDEKEQVMLFTGHAPISSGIKEADTATIITFLRDPVSRVKSLCQHVAEGKSSYLLKDIPPESFDLDIFLNSGNSRLELSNLQTKMLINSESCASPVLIERLSATAARDMALDNLFNKVAWFGLQEFFDESLIYLASMLGWKKPLYYFSRNKKKSGRQLNFGDRHLQQIADLNAIDIEVYEHAVRHFLGVFKVPDFDKEKLRWFRRINPLAAPFLFAESEVKGKLQSLGITGVGR